MLQKIIERKKKHIYAGNHKYQRKKNTITADLYWAGNIASNMKEEIQIISWLL